MDLDHPWDKVSSGYHKGLIIDIGCIAIHNDDSIYLILIVQNYLDGMNSIL